MLDHLDRQYLKQAIEISSKAVISNTCFRVGAVLVDANRKLISTGYTLELGEGWHAEAVAIKKANEGGFDTKGATIYSSIEPCSIRKSGKKDCCALLVEASIARVVYTLKEPPIFVVCQGENKLRNAGIGVERTSEFDHLVKEINRHLIV